MSHYTKVTTKIKSRSALVSALKIMGFQEHQVEIRQDNQPKLSLKGYSGDTRPQTADIRLKGAGWGKEQNCVGGASNDLGFELQEDGTYQFHVSEYDSRSYGKNWQEKFLQSYGKEVVKEVVASNIRYFIENETEENGEIFMTIGTNY